MPSPDLTGLRDAQIRLRQEFSQPVPFFTPSATTWPPGTILDPQTGEPHDPTIAPVASGWASAVVDAEVFKGGRQQAGRTTRDDEVVNTAIGMIETGQAALAIDPDDYATVDDATQVELEGERYEITQSDTDQIASLAPDRVLVWLKQL